MFYQCYWCFVTRVFPVLPVALIPKHLEWYGIYVNFPYSLEQQKML